MAMPASVQHISSHIVEQLGTATATERPLLVALQGPQGSGKSYLSGLVQSVLSKPPHSLRVAVLSIDDIYHTHADLKLLAENNPRNPLWKGRGQPGTHDVGLGIRVLQALRQNKDAVEIPRFEKSLFHGEGDRLPLDGTGPIIVAPTDVVIMEGWCMGFYPISSSELKQRWNDDWLSQRELLQLSEHITGNLECVQAVNEKLQSYVDLWSFFDVFVQLKPASRTTVQSPYSVIYSWRLEQEHAMKARNGGLGMSDEAVKTFVDRYIPGYVFFGDGVTRGHNAGSDPSSDEANTQRTGPRWLKKSLRVLIDERRDVLSVECF